MRRAALYLSIEARSSDLLRRDHHEHAVVMVVMMVAVVVVMVVRPDDDLAMMMVVMPALDDDPGVVVVEMMVLRELHPRFALLRAGGVVGDEHLRRIADRAEQFGVGRGRRQRLGRVLNGGVGCAHRCQPGYRAEKASDLLVHKVLPERARGHVGLSPPQGAEPAHGCWSSTTLDRNAINRGIRGGVPCRPSNTAWPIPA